MKLHSANVHSASGNNGGLILAVTLIGTNLVWTTGRQPKEDDNDSPHLPSSIYIFQKHVTPSHHYEAGISIPDELKLSD